MESVRFQLIWCGVGVAGDEKHGGVSPAHTGRPKDEQVMAPEVSAPGLRGEFQVRDSSVPDPLLLGALLGA